MSGCGLCGFCHSATIVLGPSVPTTDSADPYGHAKFFPSLLKVLLTAGTDLGCYGAGCIVHGRGNARPGTTFAGHGLHWSLLFHSQDLYLLVVTVLPCPSGFLPPDAFTVPFLLTWQHVLTSELLPLTLRRSVFFRARFCCLTNCPPSVLAPTPYRPQGSRYFPFCARPARVKGPHIVPLIHGACASSTYLPLARWSPRSRAIPLVHGLFDLPCTAAVARPLPYTRFVGSFKTPHSFNVWHLIPGSFIQSNPVADSKQFAEFQQLGISPTIKKKNRTSRRKFTIFVRFFFTWK